MKKIITGDWDGQPIWRYETAEDMLQAALFEEQKKKDIARQATKVAMDDNSDEIADPLVIDKDY